MFSSRYNCKNYMIANTKLFTWNQNIKKVKVKNLQIKINNKLERIAICWFDELLLPSLKLNEQKRYLMLAKLPNISHYVFWRSVDSDLYKFFSLSSNNFAWRVSKSLTCFKPFPYFFISNSSKHFIPILAKFMPFCWRRKSFPIIL